MVGDSRRSKSASHVGGRKRRGLGAQMGVAADVGVAVAVKMLRDAGSDGFGEQALELPLVPAEMAGGGRRSGSVSIGSPSSVDDDGGGGSGAFVALEPKAVSAVRLTAVVDGGAGCATGCGGGRPARDTVPDAVPAVAAMESVRCLENIENGTCVKPRAVAGAAFECCTRTAAAALLFIGAQLSAARVADDAMLPQTVSFSADCGRCAIHDVESAGLGGVSM